MPRLAWTLVACVVLHVVWTYARRKKRTQYVDAGAERVLILGASTPDGLGAELLRQYVERGAKHIMIVGRREHALDDVRKRFPGVQVHVHAADLTCTQSVLALRDAVVRCMGGLDTLHMVFGATSILPILGVAGVDPCGVNAETEERGLTHATQDGLNRIGETVQRSCDANVKGPAIVLGALIPLMQTTSSRPAVVTIGSVAGLIPAPTRAVYCASKSAQHLLVRSVDLECEAQAATPAPGQPRRARVHFLLVAPGPIKNSFVATYSVDASTGPRDCRDHALGVEDVVRATLRRVDAEQWGVLVMPSYLRVAWILACLDATYVYPTDLRRAWLGRAAHRLYRY